MKNEKGVTLVELLAAMMLLSIVLLLGFQLFTTIQILWGNTLNQYQYKNQINSITSVINNDLEDPIAFYGVDGIELRYETFDNKYKSFIYKPNNKSLWVYENNSTNNLENFSYDEGFEIANQIVYFSIKNETGALMIDTGIIQTDKLILSITVMKKHISKNGITNQSTELIEIPIETVY